VEGVADAWMPCPDGIRLATRLWRPEGPGPWPVLLMRQPYGRALASTITYAHPSWYARHGFLVAVQDVRGRGDSEGTFGGFSQEVADGAVAVRWARRLEGSNGRVGTYGFSYQGLSQLLPGCDGEGDPDPATLPDCLAPAMCGLDERRHWASEGGAHWWALGLGWALQLAAEGCRRRGDAEGWQRIRSSLEGGGFLHEGLGLLERLDPQGMGLAWLRRDPSRPEGWRSHGVAAALLRRPMLLIGGWHDPHLRGVLDLWQRARAAGGEPELRIGAWTHLDWQGGVDDVQLAFFRRHLSPAGSSAAPPGAAGGSPIQLQCSTTGLWHEVPGDGEAPSGHRWGLRSDGLAAIRCDEGELGEGEGSGGLTLVHDPWRPVPGRGGHLDTAPGPVERGDLDRRAEVACFTGAPLAEPLRLLGEPLLTLVVEADQPGFDLCVALSRVSADGASVRQLATGVARFLGGDCLEPVERQVRLQPLFASLDPAERLRLSLAASAWPQIAVNPGDGSLPRGGSGPGHRPITLTLHLKGSRLELLPLVPGGSPLPPGAN
jgi:putative CocE/NonD family hydrolase